MAFLLGAAAAALSAVTSASDPALPEALKSCMRIVQDAPRLACFDREMAALSAPVAPTEPVARARPAPTATPAATATASTAATAPDAVSKAASERTAAAASPKTEPDAGSQPVAGSPEQTFGLSLAAIRKLQARQGDSKATLKELTAHVESVYHNADGRQVLTLDNGQVWRQAETRPDFTAGPGIAVTISTGAFGSYWLATGRHNWTRVERVR